MILGIRKSTFLPFLLTLHFKKQVFHSSVQSEVMRWRRAELVPTVPTVSPSNKTSFNLKGSKHFESYALKGKTFSSRNTVPISNQNSEIQKQKKYAISKVKEWFELDTLNAKRVRVPKLTKC